MPTPTATPIVGPLTVNTVDDHDDGDCTLADCTLREAIVAANAGPGANSIEFAPPVPGVIVLTQGELPIAGDLTITGPGSSTLTISGNNASRVLNITSGTVEITGLTIANGNDSSASGGGILIEGGVTVTGDDLVVFNNRAPHGDGGGIANSGILTLTNSLVYSNTIGTLFSEFAQRGGGIANSGAMTLTGVDVTGNTVIAGASGYGYGGGIGSYYASGDVTISDSAVYSNTAPTGGGGLYLNGSGSGTGCVSDSSIFGNNTPGDGGGIFVGYWQILHLSRVTVSDNSAGQGGGGLYIDDLGYDGAIRNSTFSGNSAAGDGGGVYVANNGFTYVDFFNVTIIGNTADSDANNSGDGGGYWTQLRHHQLPKQHPGRQPGPEPCGYCRSGLLGGGRRHYLWRLQPGRQGGQLQLERRQRRPDRQHRDAD